VTGQKTGYWKRLFAALLGRDAQATGLPAGPEPGAQAAEANAKAATLEMDLRERDEKIEQMRIEYEALQASRERAVGEAGQEQLDKLFKKLSGALSNLMGLTELAEAEKDVQVADLVDLIKGLEKELTRAGLERIGTAGENTEFDVALHQRMSGGAVRAGTPVAIRLPGYRTRQKILLKAMVSAGEAQDG
jgi:molecular chaperone GrpE (heat shock protein)